MPVYPQEMPLDEIKTILEITRSGKSLEKKEELALNFWWVQGYAQKMMIGEPQMIMASTAFDGISTLEKIVASSEIGAVSPDGEVLTAFVAVPWKELATWAASELAVLLKDFVLKL